MKYIKKFLFALAIAFYTSTWWASAIYGKPSTYSPVIGYIWAVPCILTAIFMVYAIIWLNKHWNDDGKK